MVHFAIAERLHHHEPSPEFLLGSIAPDAIHMRENSNRQDKNKTHLGAEDGAMPDLITFRNFCIVNLNKSKDNGWNQFILGYVSHLYADLRWTETVWEDYTAQVKLAIDINEPIKNRYNIEVAQIDRDLYKKEKWTENILCLLAESREYSIEPLLTCQEIGQYRERTMKWLRDEMNDPQITPQYITEDIVRAFINQTADEITVLIKEWEDL